MASEQKESGSGKLEQFLVLANGTTGSAAASLVQAILQSSIFIFGDLLNHPNLKALVGTPHENWYRLLELFAHGDYLQYKASAANYPQLSPAQLKKLRQLSIVSYASTSKSLSYKQLMADLDVHNVREVEDLIIDCIYAGLIIGTLDQKQHELQVQYAIGRDIGPSDVSDMMKTLESWLQSSESLLKSLEQQQQRADQAHANAIHDAEELKKQKAEAEKTIIRQLEEQAKLRKVDEHASHGDLLAQMAQMEELTGMAFGGPGPARRPKRSGRP